MDHFFLYSVILVAGVGICYYNSLQCGFVFDDMSAIVENRDLKPHVPVTNLFWNDFWGTPMKMEKSHKSYRPICVLTFRLNYAFSELEPMSYHLVNAVLHGVVCIIMMRVCTLFLKSLPSFLSAILFAVHPIHTEAVTGVVGRAESLSSIFFLSALLSYSKCTAYHGKTYWRWLIFTVILVTIAMLCKEQGITVVGVCCVYEVFIAQRMKFSECLCILRDLVSGKPVFPQWLRSAVFRTLVLIGSTTFMLFARIRVMGAQLPVFTNFDNPASMAPSPSRHLTLNYLLPVNAWLLIHPSEMCCDWTMGTIPLVKSLADHRNIFTIMFYLIFIKFIIFSLKQQGPRSRAIIMSLSFMVLPFIPASNLFFPVGFVVAERILYTPSMGFSILVALGFHLIIENKRSLRFLGWLALGTMILAHSAKTISRNEDWKDEYSIFKAGLIVNQKNAKLFNNVGHALEKYEDFDTALKFFRKATRVQPDDIGAHINVGRTYKNLNMSHEAEMAYVKAMDLFPPVIPGKSYSARIAPNHLSVFTNLVSLISKNKSRLLEADMLYRTAINMRPDYTQAYINRGDILLKMGKPKEAQEQYETALQYETDNPDTYYNLGVIHLEQKNHKLAQKYFNQALEVEPDHKQTLFNSAALMQELGNPADIPLAMSRLEKLIKITPNDPKVYFNLGMLSMDERNYNNAEAWFIKAIELEHGFRSALFNLALMLTNDLKKPLDAVPYLKQLIQFHPDHVKAYILMGDINVNVIKDLSEAEKNFEKVLELDPSDIQAKHNLCVVYVEQGDLIRAEKCLTAVHYEAPKEDYIINHLNIIRTRLNKAQEQMKMERAAQAHKETGSTNINPTDNMQETPDVNGERMNEDANLEAEKQAREQQRIEAELQARQEQRLGTERQEKEQQKLEAEIQTKEKERLEAELQAKEKERLEAERQAKEQQRLEAERQEKEQQRLEAEIQTKEKERLEAKLQAKEQQRLEAELQTKEKERLEAELQAKEKERLEAERQAKEQQRLEAERQEKEQQRLEAEIQTKENERLEAEWQRLEAEHQAKEQQRLEAERQAKEQQMLEADRQAKKQKRLEAEHQAKDIKRLEADRQAKEKERLETERQRLDKERFEKEHQRLEAERQAKEQERLGAERQAKEIKKLEEEQAKEKQRLKTEWQRLEVERQAKEQQRLEAELQAREKIRLEAEHQAKEKEQQGLEAERHEKENERLEAEWQRLEAEHQAKEQQRLEAERQAKEQQRLEAEHQEREQQRLEAKSQAREQQRLEAERQAKEQERLEAERQAKEKERLENEQQRLETERQAKEQKRLEAELHAKEQQRLEAELQVKEKERLEAERQAKEKERLETERQAKESERQAKNQQILEAENQAKEQQRLEAESQAKEQQRLEAESQTKEQQRLEAESQAREQQRLEAERQAREQQRLEAERQAKEQKRLEAERQAKEQQRLEAESQAKEQQRLEAETQAREQQRLEAERQAREQQRLEAELQAKEKERLEAERQAKEKERLETERQAKESERQAKNQQILEAEHQAKEKERLEKEQQRLEVERQEKEQQRLEIERQAKEQWRAKDEKQNPRQ